jgi:hypothetical protein
MTTNKRTLTELAPTGLRVPKRRMPVPVRDKASARVIAALARDFETHGAAAIDDLRTKNPATYMRLVAALLPKDVPQQPRPLEGMTNEEIDAALAALDGLLARKGAARAGEGDPRDE